MLQTVSWELHIWRERAQLKSADLPSPQQAWSAARSEPGLTEGGSMPRLVHRRADRWNRRLCEAGGMVPVERIELPTFGLQNRCSTAELNRRIEDVSERRTKPAAWGRRLAAEIPDLPAKGQNPTSTPLVQSPRRVARRWLLALPRLRGKRRNEETVAAAN
jgi:hypothetical protein